MSVCAACGAENDRRGARFCTRCGAALDSACPTCGAERDPGDNFCAECGTTLVGATPTTPSCSPGTRTVAAEKKHITVLFADVAGSMDLQERLDAEVWAQIMGRFVSILVEGVRKYGGTVDKFTGDGIMALFGAPVAQEDHARRACHAAWHLTKVIGSYSEELRRERGVELHVRLGLNSGEVIVGRVGDDVTVDPTALGHTVGLAQRMEALAEPGKAYLTEFSARLVGGWFDLEQLGPRPVPGAKQLMGIYVLGRPRSTPVHQTVGVTPLVGRHRELATLEEALALAEEGHALVVGVVGEAGVGKSRLCGDFAKSAADRGITVRRAAGMSHGRDLPLLPILAFQRDYFGITDLDDPPAARRKVAERLLDLDPELEAALPLMFDFLAIPDPERPVGAMAPEVRSERIFDIVRRITARRSERETLVLVFEDLHWFDPDSEAFLERLIESYPGSRTLVLTNFRPEYSARWMRHSYYRQVPLLPLDPDAVRRLLEGLLGSDASLASLIDFLIDRTGGNPFFVEEVVRDLLEKGILQGLHGSYRLTRSIEHFEVPPSVQAVLAARIDRLTPAPRELLQAGAVIGPAFPKAVLARVSGLNEPEVEARLRDLCRAELLYEAASGATEYRFWHPLTQEVAYGSLLGADRERLHAAVADVMAESQRQRTDERVTVVAFHYQHAGDHRNAAVWEDRAATWASRRDAREAMRRWRAALAHVAAVPADEEAQTVGLHVRSQLLRVGARAGLTEEETNALFIEAKASAECLRAESLLARLYHARGTERVLRGQIRSGIDAYWEAQRLSGRQGDKAMQAAICTGLSAVLAYTGPLEEALRLADAVAAASRGDPEEGVHYLGFSPLVRSLLSRAEILGLTGYLPEAARQAEQAVDQARQRRESETLAWTLSFFPVLEDLCGPTAESSLPKAEEALRIAEQSGNLFVRFVALRAKALAMLLEGRLEEAETIAADALAQSRQRHLAVFEEARLLVCLARSRLALADHRGALSASDEAVQAARSAGLDVFACLALVTRGRVRRIIGGPSLAGAASDLAAALQLIQTTGATVYESLVREELGWLHRDEGELRAAQELYRRVGAHGHHRRLERELATKAM